jgi:hypothetical protein
VRVYVLIDAFYDSGEIEGVYEDERRALSAAQRLNERDGCNRHAVEEHEIIEGGL